MDPSPFDSAGSPSSATPPVPPAPATPPILPVSSAKSDENNMGMLCHLAALSGYIGLPFGHIAGPLIIWLMKRQEMPFVDSEGKESLNFQISMTIYIAISLVLCIVLVGIPMLIALYIGNLILVIMASVRSSSGQPYRYPFTIRFIQ